MAAAPPHALEVTPESALQFVLTRDGEDTAGGGDGSSKCTMTLRHTGQTTESIAFKVSSMNASIIFIKHRSIVAFHFEVFCGYRVIDLSFGRICIRRSGEIATE